MKKNILQIGVVRSEIHAYETVSKTCQRFFYFLEKFSLRLSGHYIFRDLVTEIFSALWYDRHTSNFETEVTDDYETQNEKKPDSFPFHPAFWHAPGRLLF